MSRITRAVLAASLIAPLSSCMDRTLATVEADPVAEERVDFDVSENRDLDLLFVIDNSNSMEREQASLADKFSRVINKLSEHPDGLPSIHIAVVSTDLGAGGEPGNGCSVNGDGGRFLGSDCDELSDPFLRSIATEDGDRVTNFSGQLSDAFACMATLGNRGCGFEQPLEAMRQALSQPQASDFLREHAYLAVVLVTDEDDCSVRDTAMFNGTPQDLSTHLGPPKSFRCFEFGVECEGDDPRSLGPRENCVPRDNSEYLYDVNEYVDFLYELKPFPEQVLVATIAGELAPINVVTRHDSGLDLDYRALEFSCTELDAEAVPPIRLAAFVDGFADDSSQRTSICDADLSSSLDDIADLLKNKAAACIQSQLADTDPDAEGLQPECVISERGPAQEERRLPACDNPEEPEMSAQLPCYTLLENPVCADTPTGLSPKVYYPEGYTVPPGTSARASCLVGS